MVRSPSGQGSLAHLVVAEAQPLKRSSRDIPDKRAHHNKPSTTRATTLSGPIVVLGSAFSGCRPMLFPPKLSTSARYAPDHPPPKPYPSRRVGEDDIARLLAEHVHSSNDEETGMRGKTDASTTLSLVIPCAKVAVHHGHLVPFQSHLAGTGRVVIPGLVPGELPYLLPGTDALSRHRLLLDNFTR